MLYEELMLEPASFTKFSIFKFLTRNQQQEDFPIHQLADEMDLNYQQTAIFLSEINKNIQAISKSQPSILTKAGKIDLPKLVVTIDDYRYFLLKESIPFQFIVYFLNASHPTLDQFCEQHYVSRSTVARKMAPLKKHVKKFNIRFTFTESNLTGDERIVRVALFNALWLATRGNFWPFTVPQAEVERLTKNVSKYFPLSNTYLGSRELTYFAAIFICRTSKKFFVEYDKRYDFLMKDNPYYDFDHLKHEAPFCYLPNEQAKAECSFIFFLAHYSPFYTMEDSPSLNQTLKDFSERPNKIYPFVQRFLNYSAENIFTYDHKVPDLSMIAGNLINVTFTYYILRQPFPDLQNLVLPPKKKKKPELILEEKITTFFKQFENGPHFTKDIQEPMIQAYKSILLPYYDSPEYSEPLKVGVALEHNFILVRKVYRFLYRLGFTHAGPFQESNADSYDLVISSSLLPLTQHPNLPFHFWDLNNGAEEFSELYRVLQTIFEEKNQIE